MGFAEAIRTCFSKYAVFSGRAKRPEYWWFVLFAFLGAALLSLLDTMIFGTDPRTGESPRILAGLFQLAIFLPMLAAAWRRMHDTGRPGWYVLLPMLFSFVFILVTFSGVLAFMIELRTSDPNGFIGVAALMGGFGLMVLSIVQFVLAILMIWWLTRPSEPGPNAYGPA